MAVHCIIRYLQGTSQGLLFSSGPPLHMTVYFDSDWVVQIQGG